MPAVVSSPRKTRSVTSGKRVAPVSGPPKAAVAKKVKVSAAKGKAKEPAGSKAKDNGEAPPAEGSSKTIIVEACKQCSSFKIRAEAVKNGLESAVTGITVVINPEKPRRGCFEIRQSGGEVFVSLLAMPRPFTKMKNLDMDQVVADIAKKLA